MTYSTMLVDDESIDLEWLSRRVSEHKDKLSVDAAVNSGFAALQLLRERPFDIMISDIRMPILSGLELAAKARELRPELQIVFISGHEDFEYAKQAIKVNASAYLLKPVDDDELKDTVRQLVAKLDAERQSRDTGKRLQEALPHIEKELLLGWLEGTVSPELEPVAAKMLEPLAREEGLELAVLEIDDLEWKLSDMGEEERRSLLQRIHQTIRVLCEEEGEILCLPDKQHRLVLVAACGRSRLEGLAERVLACIREQYHPLTATLAVGSTARHPAELRTAFKHARCALKEKLFVGKNRLILYRSETKQPAPGLTADIEKAAEAMFHDMLNYQLVSIDERLEALFRQLDGYDDKAAIIHLIVHYISRLHMHCGQWNENLYELLQWEYGSLRALDQFETLQDMKSWLRRKFFELSELLYRKQQKQNRKTIASILSYIDEGLESKLTLKQVAEHFGFSPNYLGQLFKEEAGEHFSDYLIRARVRRACELLLDPALKIYEIADRMGYKNILYFNRQFKQQTGMTPGDYRKANKV